MNWFEAAEFSKWKNLSKEEKKEVFGPLLMYFVNPLIQITQNQLTDFEMYGMKCQTFQMKMNGEDFVFIPGQRDVILGWDAGAKGLKVHELLEKSNSKDLNLEKSDNLLYPENFGIETLDDINQYINQNTTLLRKVDLPPMLVSVHAIPVGATFCGVYHCVTGQFSGDENFFQLHQSEITRAIQGSGEKSLFSLSYEKSILYKQKFYLEQIKDTDSYAVYQHKLLTYHEQKNELENKGFSLLSENAWEYAVGGGTRRLFRWGNDLSIDLSQDPLTAYQKMRQPNMFGLSVDCTQQHYELTDNPLTVKLGRVASDEASFIKKILPFSSYYQSYHQLDFTKQMDPTLYSFRKAIILENPE